MVQNPIKPLNQIASFLKVPAGKLSCNENSLPSRVVNKNSSSGYLNIIFDLLKEAKSDLQDSNEVENAEIRQWLEYAVIYVLKAETVPSQVLQELNLVLSSRTYLVAHKLTIADVFLYYVLQNAMENLSLLDKEKYVNLSRWFNNLQQNPELRQSNKTINFSTLYLVSAAPARH